MSVGKHPRRPLRSSGPIERGKAMKRGGRITPKKRKPSEFARIYGSRARVEWVKSLPCLCAGRMIGPHVRAMCGGEIQNVHTENGGVSRKADANTIVALCADHHRSLHLMGVRSFQNVYALSLKSEAARIAAAWLARGEEER